MISIFRTKFLTALRKLTHMQADVLPPDAADLVVCLCATLYSFPARDIRMLTMKLKNDDDDDKATSLEWYGRLDAAWEIAVFWQPLHNYVSAENCTTFFLERKADCLFIQPDRMNGTFKECKHEE